MTATARNREEAPTRLRAVELEEGTACRASDGAEASLERGDDGGDVLVLRGSDGAVLFEYHASTTRCVVHQSTGDLVLRVPAGAVEIEAADGVRVRGGKAFEVEADLVRTSSDDFEVTSAEMSFIADVIETRTRRLRQHIDLLDTRAGRIIERAKETYRDVEHLAQTRAGRIRFVAEKTYHVLGERTLIKAIKDVKLKGEKIYLG